MRETMRKWRGPGIVAALLLGVLFIPGSVATDSDECHTKLPDEELVDCVVAFVADLVECEEAGDSAEECFQEILERYVGGFVGCEVYLGANFDWHPPWIIEPVAMDHRYGTLGLWIRFGEGDYSAWGAGGCIDLGS